MKSILNMTEDERKIYIRRKAVNRVKNKINNKFRILEELKYAR